MARSPQTCLLVDDSPTDREIVRRYITRAFGPAVRCVEVETGAEALAAYAQFPPDCVLIDYNLPDMSGLDVLDALYAAHGRLGSAMIMLTGSGDQPIAVEAMKRGAQDYLVKQRTDQEHLRRAVENALAKVELQRDLEQSRRALETQYAAAEAARRQVTTILASITDAFFAVDHEWRLVYANAAAEQVLGRPSAQLVGQDLWQAVPALRDVPLGRQLQTAQRTGSVVAFEEQLGGAWFAVRGYPSEDGIAVNLRDITERKRADDELRRREREFRMLVQNAPDVISRFDRQLRHVYVSPAVELATGLPPAVFIGKTNRELGMPADLCDAWAARSARIFATGLPDEFEFTTPTPTGPRHYHSQLVPELDASGAVESILSIARDVTATKRAELALRFLSDASLALASSLEYEATLTQVARLAVPAIADWCAISLLNDDGTLTRVAVVGGDVVLPAPALDGRTRYDPEATFGPSYAISTRRSQLISQVPDRLHTAAAANRQQLAILKQLGLRATMTVPLLRGDRALGAIMFAATTSNRQFDADDLALAEELARRAVVAIENTRLYRAAQEALRERDAFVAIASHELRNPLTTLLGRAELLRIRGTRTGVFAERDLADLQIIVRQAQRINALLGDLLGAVQVGNESFAVTVEPVNLVRLVTQAVTTLQPLLTKHMLVVQGDSAVDVTADPVRVDQIVQNLLGNAIKYSPDGGTITVEITHDEREACLAISDQGLGMPPEALPLLFRRFYRVPSSARVAEGTGIGLFVVKELVERQGGRVEVSSTLGVGSTFAVRLPLTKVSDARPAQHAKQPTA